MCMAEDPDPVAERRDEVLKRMLNTPPKPHKTEPGKREENVTAKPKSTGAAKPL